MLNFGLSKLRWNMIHLRGAGGLFAYGRYYRRVAVNYPPLTGVIEVNSSSIYFEKVNFAKNCEF